MDDTQRQIDELRAQIKVLADAQNIDRNIDVEQQDQLREIVKDRVADTVWDDFWYEFVYFFDSAQVSISSATSSPSIDTSNGINFITGSTSGQHQSVAVSQQPSGLFSIDRETRFRVLASFGNLGSSLTANNRTAYITTLHTGTATSQSGNNHLKSGVGFKLVDNVLYGVAYRDGQETLAYLTEVEEDDATGTRKFYKIELEYFPKDHVDFYIDSQYYGSVSTNLPAVEATTALNQSRFFSLIYTQESAQKAMKILNYELMHRKT